MSEAASLLFDTTALVDIYRGRLGLKTRLQSVAVGGLHGYISAISEAELWYGVKPAEVERHEAMLSYFVTLPLDSRAARLAGKWMQEHQARGLGWMDALITATGVQAKLTILTRDARLGKLLADEASFEVYSPGL